MTDAQAGAADANDAQIVERDYEAEAGKDGWVPKEQFTGDPKRWRDAKSYVEYGEIRSEVRKEFDGRVSRLEKANTKIFAQQEARHKKDIDGLKEQRREAIRAGNVEKADEISDQIDKAKDAAPDKTESAGVDKDFAKRNPWYGDDPELTDMAIKQSNLVLQAYSVKHDDPMPPDEMFDAVEAKVKASALYKERFGGKPAANGHAAVDGGSENPGPRSKTKSWADLPAEAKKAWNGFPAKVKAEMTQDKYAKEYWEDA